MKTDIDMKHTPTPWHLQANTHVPNVGIYRDVTEKGDVHGTWEVIAFLDNDMERARANAEFIVRAVNSHEALLEAAKLLFRWIGTEDPNETFEDIGEWFRKETGSLRPGKDSRGESDDQRRLKWDIWRSAKFAEIRMKAKVAIAQAEARP